MMLVLYSSAVFAQQGGETTPEGPDTINVTEVARYPLEGAAAQTVVAAAGNVTELVISDVIVTQAWQGYHGNITGQIVLSDSSSNIFYDWQIANPQGEIYAANHSNTIDWLGVYCLNVTQNEGGSTRDHVDLPLTRPDGSHSTVNSSRVEAEYGINRTDHDGLNETFHEFYTGEFFVAGDSIAAEDGCSVTHPYVNSTTTTLWDEVILSDNNTLIFASIINEDTDNFRSGTSDFQMLVLEDGHTQAGTSHTNWYFYVEIS